MKPMHDSVKAAFAVSLLVFFVFTWMYWDYTMDDSYITFRYSENWVEGDGPVWNADDDPVQGYSNFLWMALAALFMKLHLPYLALIKLTGIIFAILGLYWLFLLGKELFHDVNLAMLPVVLLACSMTWGFWAVGGMECGVFTAVMIGCILLAIREDASLPQFPMLGLAFAALALIRHEGAVIFTVTWFVLASKAVEVRKNGVSLDKKRSLYLLKVGAVFSIMYLAYLYWSYVYYGYPLPNPFYAKIKPGEGWGSIATFAKHYWVYLTSAILGLGVIFISKAKKRWYVLVALIVLVSNMILVNRDTIMDVEFRLLMHTLPLILLLSVPFFKVVRDNCKNKVALAVLFVVLMLNPTAIAKNIEHHDTYIRYTTNLHDVQGGIGTWIEKNTPKNVTIATVDAGILVLNSKRRAIDYWGLSDEYVAHHGFDLKYFWSQHPDIIILFSIYPDKFVTNYNQEVLMTSDPYFLQNFELVYVDSWKGQDYSQWVFARKSLRLRELYESQK